METIPHFVYCFFFSLHLILRQEFTTKHLLAVAFLVNKENVNQNLYGKHHSRREEIDELNFEWEREKIEATLYLMRKWWKPWRKETNAFFPFSAVHVVSLWDNGSIHSFDDKEAKRSVAKQVSFCLSVYTRIWPRNLNSLRRSRHFFLIWIKKGEKVKERIISGTKWREREKGESQGRVKSVKKKTGEKREEMLYKQRETRERRECT